MADIICVTARNQHISPKKARLVMNLIRSKSVESAQSQLKFIDKKASKMILSLLNSAIDGAKAKNFNKEDLQVSLALCQEGRKLKRNHPNARGRVNVFKKRMSHLKLSLSEAKKEEKKVDKRSQKSRKVENGSKS